MSKIVADNLRALTDAVETPMKYPVRGSAKVWFNLNGSGTIAGRDSINITSYTDNGTGDYTGTFTAAMANTNYAQNISAAISAVALNVCTRLGAASSAGTGVTTNATRMCTGTGGGAAADAEIVSLAAMGALA